MTLFSELGLRAELLQAITELGYTEPTAIQADMIPLMLTGVDVIGQAQTGTGKTAAFALPLLNNLEPGRRHVQALILAPTRELALQVSKAIDEYGKHMRVSVLSVYGGQSYMTQINSLKRGVDVVVGTPGRLMDLMRRKSLDLSHVRTVVLDEADEMLSMGFVDDIETILAETPETRQTALFSATLPTQIRRLAEKYMHDVQSVTVQRDQMTVSAISQRYYLVNEGDKTAALTRLFEMEDITSALIFARTRLGAGDLSSELNRRGYPADVLSGDLSQDARERTLSRFRRGQINVLVATDVAARGLDIDDISHVFNFDLPDDAEVFVHRVGRTGRAGKAGIAISLVSPKEKRRLKTIEHFTRQKMERAELPTEEDVLKRREDALLEKLRVWINRGRAKREAEMVETLAAEGIDPLVIAAAALKMSRGEEKQRPIAPINQVVEHQVHPKYGKERDTRRERGGARSGGIEGRKENSSRESFRDRKQARPPMPHHKNRDVAPVSHEEGMVRLSLSMGREHGIRPKDIVGTLAFHADIPGSTIGKIFIQDQHTLVDVPVNMAGKVLAKNGEFRFNREVLLVKKA